MMIVKDLTQKSLIAGRVRVARNFLERLRGLLGMRKLEKNEGLWIPQCQGVHTFGMAYPLDIVFLGGDFTVVGLAENLEPNLPGPVYWEAKSVLEFPAGTIQESGMRIGDKLGLENLDEGEMRAG